MSVRLRSVLVAVSVVLLALLLGGTGMLFALQSNLEQSAEATGRARAAEIVARITSDGLRTTTSALADQARTDAVSQVVSSDGIVIGSSQRNAQVPLSDQRPGVGVYTSVEADLPTLDDGGEWKVITTSVSASGAAYYVIVAVPIKVQRATVQTVAVFLLGGTPVLLFAVAIAVWLLVGRALRSVDRIRGAVAEIDARRLAARVEVPPTRDEINALAVTMNSMLDRLESSDRVQRAFISDASHELRSPLTTLSSAAELATQADEATRTRLLATMNSELARMRELVENLMALARMDSGASGEPQDLDLDDVVGNETSRLRITSTIAVQASVQPARVLADPRSVGRALRNLVDNAQRHASTTIRLTLQVQGREAVLWVDNDGPIIGNADRARIFERFVRLDDSRSRDAGGSGLGLAISRAGLQSQGGDVEVVDAPDGWCRFEIRLPLASDGAGGVAAPGAGKALGSGTPAEP